MRNFGLQRSLAFIAIFGALSLPAFGAQGTDPDWPCIQRKVPELSLGQIWTGGELPPSAADWSKDPAVSDLVRELSARRVPVEQAQDAIGKFAADQPASQAAGRLTKLLQGLFDQMNAERTQVIAGIGRYARNQAAMAARLRSEASKVDALRTKPDADQNELALRMQQLTLESRIFEERVQSLTYVCEVPTIIEQRLYALAKSIAAALPRK